MAGVKSVQMFHDMFHENSVHNKEDREGLSKLFKWNIHVKNNMIINCIKTGKTSIKGISTQEYQKYNDTMFQKNIITFTFADVASILKNYWNHVREANKNKAGKTVKIPHCKKYSVSLGRQAFDIVDDTFTFTVIPYKLKISIQLPPYMIEILNNHVVCSAIITPTKLSISYRQKVESEMTDEEITMKKTIKVKKPKPKTQLKEKTILKPIEYSDKTKKEQERKPVIKKKIDRDYLKDYMNDSTMIGFDRNFKNMTGYDTDGNVTVYDTSEILKIKNQIRETISHFNRQDRRMFSKIASKYWNIGNNRVMSLIHKITTDIANNYDVVVLEDLTGLTDQWNKDKSRRKDMNFNGKNWMYAEFARQLEYKMKWKGKILIYIDPRYTSQKCSVCDAKMCVNGYRKMKCKTCGIVVDRDLNASENILDKKVCSPWIAS